MVLLPARYEIDFAMNVYRPQRRLWDNGYSRLSDNEVLKNFINQKITEYAREPTSATHRQDLLRICRLVISENLQEQQRIKLGGRKYDWTEYALPHPDPIIGLVTDTCLLLDRVDLAKDAVSAAERQIPDHALPGLMVRLSKFSSEDLRSL